MSEGRIVSYDVVVVGGGPAGATAAADLAASGQSVLLLDRDGRTKPCGGAIPTKAITEFDIPPHLLTARIRSARIFAPSKISVDMRIDDGFVGMVDRNVFDPWLRARAQSSGAVLVAATFETASQIEDGRLEVRFSCRSGGPAKTVRTRMIVGADGANSAVRHQLFGRQARPPYVFAYHEIVRSPAANQHASFDPQRCDVYYHSNVSPDFYGWVFPHGGTTSVGVGSAVKGFDLRQATRLLREQAGIAGQEIVREEGAPLPLKAMKRWDNGRNAVLVGDAAGVVAPSSGEGIYYAMLCGRLAAEAGREFLATNDVKALARVRQRFMRLHGRVFMVLGFMQGFWYRNDKRRERFVSICEDRDVQRLVWESYLNKRFVRTAPLAHLRVFLKDIGHLVRMAFQ